ILAGKGKLLDICLEIRVHTWSLPPTRVTSSSLSLTFESFLPSAPEMRTELRVAPSESMDSSDSSLDLTAKLENPKAIVARRTSPVRGSRYPPIGPPSVIGAEEVAGRLVVGIKKII
ncbi:hypothetical protein HID58_092682, partial [Brassica napus]